MAAFQGLVGPTLHGIQQGDVFSQYESHTQYIVQEVAMNLVRLSLSHRL
jgi:hypothetical protein